MHALYKDDDDDREREKEREIERDGNQRKEGGGYVIRIWEPSSSVLN